MAYKAITFANTKGGTGKSTLALGMAWELHRRGARVMIVDVDPQGSATVGAELVMEAGRTDTPLTMAFGQNVRRELATVAADYDFVVIDTPGSASDRTPAGLIAAAMAPGGGVGIIPLASPMDVLAIGSGILPIVETVRGVVDLPMRFVLNGHLSTSTVGSDVREAVSEVDNIPVLESEVHARTPLVRAAQVGVGVTEFDPGSVAAMEMARLTDEIIALIEGGAP